MIKLKNIWEYTFKKTFKEKPIESSLAISSTICLLFIAILFNYWAFIQGSNAEAIIIDDNNTNDIFVVEPNEYIIVERLYCITTENVNGVLNTINGNENDYLSSRNCYKTNIRFQVPDLPPGEYRYNTYIRHQVNPFRSIDVNSETIRFDIQNHQGVVPEGSIENIRNLEE